MRPSIAIFVDLPRIGFASHLTVARLGLATGSRSRLLTRYRSAVQFSDASFACLKAFLSLVDLPRIELGSRQCECRVVPLHHRPSKNLSGCRESNLPGLVQVFYFFTAEPLKNIENLFASRPHASCANYIASYCYHGRGAGNRTRTSHYRSVYTTTILDRK